MHYQALLASIALLSASTAALPSTSLVGKTVFVPRVGRSLEFTHPTALGDGIFIVAHGNTHHNITKVSEIISHNHTEKGDGDIPALLAERAPIPSGDVGCSSNYVASGDYAVAKAQFEGWCGGGQWTYNSVYTVYRTCAMFECNYGSKNDCNANELDQALAAIAPRCPGYQGGWDVLNAWAKSYGYDKSSAGICGNAAKQAYVPKE